MRTTTPPPRSVIAAEIERTLRLLHPGAQARWEIRALHVPGMGTASGYYDDPAVCARDVARTLDGRASAVNVLLNVPDPTVLARAYNKLIAYARTNTADSEILQRQWLPLDCDPKRLTGISSTDVEHEASLAKAATIAAFLRACGWPAGILADSANGGHL